MSCDVKSNNSHINIQNYLKICTKMKNDKRSYTLLDNLQTSPNIFYLAKIDHDKEEGTHH